MSYGYPMGGQSYQGAQQQHHPPPQQGFGQGAGWQQQQQAPPPPQHGGYQGLRYGQPPPPPSDHYGHYGQQFQQNVFSINAAQAVGFGGEAELQQAFACRQSRTYQAVQAEELMAIMNETPQIKNYYQITWSLELCKIMVAMLDRNRDGMMQYPEFKELLQCLTYWFQTFCQYDTNRSRFIEAQELGRCIKEKFGYQLSAKAMEAILKRYSRAMDDGRLLIAFDDFVSLSVRLRAYTEAFRARDRTAHGHQETGSYTFSYDDFLQCTICL